MRNFIFCLSLFFLMATAFHGNAQSLIFCKTADNGRPVNAAQEFTVNKDGGKVTLLLQLPPSIHPSAVSFDIYKVKTGKEIFGSTVKQALEPGKNWVSKEVTFYDAGTYRVYAFDDKDNTITKGNLTIKVAGNQP
jgi:hypothetical protein